ncbi:DegT/DnrJ/EryC1/StrS family aminotransferase [uncultured Jannaschia sp.]|uniref:DegT/DnrJ/EryC1/StrS family aminotransferase n=1 Tax=uncultured Jannaschia sp. TaxID=293347 RepID=UPI00262679BA|nr:DegT/DnrJ/EryC1/StrS family aminotransferase [uncultured Jannaschia sp.]
MTKPRFRGSFTQQEPICEAGIAAALAVMRSGRLHRYNTAADETAEAALLERDFAAWQGARFCLAVTSGGQAMQIAMRAAGVAPGDTVLTNAFTLAPVPGAIAAIGARTALVEITPDLVLDLEDFDAKARATGARWLLLSHMRGHLCDMDRLTEIAAARGVTVIEDCAHTMGAAWAGRRSGGFGLAGCFSTQTYKHMNSGEGGLLTSDDEGFMARATILSGSYMLHDRHGAGPQAEAFADARLDMPNLSARMDNLRAALLRPQIARLDANLDRWNALHDRLAHRLRDHPALRLPARPPEERYVGSSIQVTIPGIGAEAAAAFVNRAAADGVELKWFGAPAPAGFTSSHRNWRYVPAQTLPRTDAILSGLFDMRLPLTFGPADCDAIAEVIRDTADATGRARSA